VDLAGVEDVEAGIWFGGANPMSPRLGYGGMLALEAKGV
jgi:hypothetical protein